MQESGKLIVSVCRGNIARSAVAEAIIRQELAAYGLTNNYTSISRGVQGTSVDPQPVLHPNITHYHPLYEDSRPTLERLGIDLSGHVSRPIDQLIAQQACLMLAMDQKTRDALYVLFPSEATKVHLLSELIGATIDLADPEGLSGPEQRDQVFSRIHGIIMLGFPKLLELAEATY